MAQCSECESRKRALEQAESALNFAIKKIKRLDLMKYSEVADWEREAAPLKRNIITAKSNVTRHAKKCGVNP